MREMQRNECKEDTQEGLLFRCLYSLLGFKNTELG